MKNKIVSSLLAICASLFFANAVFADTAVKYYEINFAPYTATAPGIPFPVFVYQKSSTNGWKQVINGGNVHGARSALFTGGEVMTRSDAPEIIEYSLQNRLETSILTNGYRLEKRGGNFVNRLKRVQISLDSASPQTHDARRGEGSWRVARQAIDYARSCGTPVEISTTISPKQLDELEGIVGIAYNTESRVLVRLLQYIGRAIQLEKERDFSFVLDKRKQQLAMQFGDIFVDDFARYVPQGENHDAVALADGYVTVLPNGIIRGLNRKILQLGLAA